MVAGDFSGIEAILWVDFATVIGSKLVFVIA